MMEEGGVNDSVGRFLADDALRVGVAFCLRPIVFRHE